MARLASLALALCLHGCALLPDGTEMGMWIRFGPEAGNSVAFQWSSLPADPTWRCPPEAERGELGVPAWLRCPGDMPTSQY